MPSNRDNRSPHQGKCPHQDRFDRIDRHLVGQDEKLDTIGDVLHGNGTPENGLVVRFSVMEAKMTLLLWVIGMVGSATIVAIVGGVWALLNKGGQ